MSTILDALRKAEADAKRGKQPTRATQEMLDVGPLPPSTPPGRRLGPWASGVAVVAAASAAGVGGWWLANRSADTSLPTGVVPQAAVAPAAAGSSGPGAALDLAQAQRAALPAASPAAAPPPPPIPPPHPASVPVAPAAPVARPVDAAAVPAASGAPAEVAPAPAVVVPAVPGPGAAPQVVAAVEAPASARTGASAALPPDGGAAPSVEGAATGEADPAALPPRRRVDLPRLERRDPEEAARARQARAERQRSIRADIIAARQSRQNLREAMEDARADAAAPPTAAGANPAFESERTRLPAETVSDIPPNAVRRVPAGAPEIKLSIVQWSATPSRRFAFVTVPGGTMSQVREGEEVNGLTVNRIYQGAVEFSHAGQTFVLRAN